MNTTLTLAKTTDNNQAPTVTAGAFSLVLMEKLINEIQKIILQKGRITIAIDGPCASGKTTLASALSKKFGAQIIHTDDFFLPFDMRTEERLSQAGGNVHYERFADEVVAGIKKGESFVYGIFDCGTGVVSKSEPIYPHKNIIIEGAYSLHPEIPDDIYDLKIFIETDIETQLERILNRNGAKALETFKSKWIPFENRYFDEYKIKWKCDIILQTKMLV